MKDKLKFTAIALLFAAILWLPKNSFGQAGSLDLTFDTDGKVATSFGSLADVGNAIAIQSDGKILVAGYYTVNQTSYLLALARYNSNGALDNTFDADGKVTTDFGDGQNGAASIAIQADGKIVVAGSNWNGSDEDITLSRYNTDGSLDNTFDADGKVTTSFGGDESGSSVVIQSDGKIVVGGYLYNGNISDFLLVRYNPDGSLDNSFDSDGKVTTDFGTIDEGCASIAIQSDGKIVAVGYAGSMNNAYFALARYNIDGSLDNGFDSDGKSTTDFTSLAEIGFAVKIQSDGKIVAAGYAEGQANVDFALARYNNNGSLDVSFDSDGKVTTDFGASDDIAWGMTIQNDGKLVVTGFTDNGTSQDIALARYNTDGSLDNGFDNDGKVTTDNSNGSEAGSGVAIQSDGKIVVAGFTGDAAQTMGDIAVVRYNGTSPVTTGLGETNRGPLTISLYPNPFNSIATVQFNTSVKDGELSVYNVSGAMVKKIQHVSGQSIVIKRDDLPKGIYLIELTEETKIIAAGKIVVSD